MDKILLTFLFLFYVKLVNAQSMGKARFDLKINIKTRSLLNFFLRLMLIVAFSQFGLAQNLEDNLKPIDVFYSKALRINDEYTEQVSKEIFQKKNTSKNWSKLTVKYKITEYLRELNKKRLDSIIKIIKNKNTIVNQDMLYIAKVILIDKCDKVLILKYPQYDFCELKVRDTLIDINENIKRSIIRDRIYYVTKDSIDKGNAKRLGMDRVIKFQKN